MNNFSIFGQIAKEIEEFNEQRIHIAGTEVTEEARYLKRQEKGYFFSQRDTLNVIDLYYNSKFESGPIDSEGQTKLFLNICAFRADVASKMIDLDTKDFVFIPDDESSKWGTYFIQKRFRDWVRENYFGQLINELVENFPRYGTVVVKRVGKTLERIPLRTLINQQDAKSLATATYVIEVHNKMSIQDMEKYPDWDTTDVKLEFGDTATVYERYGLVPAEFYYEQLGQECPESECDKSYDCVVICTLDSAENKKKSQKDATGVILFCEKVIERPYLEEHWKQQDGRWLGIGEVENQFENQIARNMIANLRRRSLLWGSKKLFQSADSTVNKNLIRDVKDGDVLAIMPGMNITQLDTTSKNVGEFASTEEVWEHNSDQKSFTYEAATGESLPSGTSFRLGVVVSNAVNSHFGFKKEKLGLFLKQLVEDFVFDIFKKDNSKEHIISIFGNAEGIVDLKKAFAEIEFSKRLMDWAMNDNSDVLPDFEAIKQGIEQGYKQKSHLFVEIPTKFYDDIKHHMELSITGEEIDIKAQIDSLTTVYQSLVQSQDPRAEQVLNRIMSLTGNNLEAILGPKPQAPANPQQPSKPGGGVPSTMPQVPNPTNAQPAVM